MSTRSQRPRAGFALLLTLLLSTVFAALAVTASYLGSGQALITKQYERESDFKYAAEYALQFGKSWIGRRATPLPDSGYITIATDMKVPMRPSGIVPGVAVDLFAGRTGNTTGQFGNFVRVVAVARDATGARIIRRLELQEENFARYNQFIDTWPTGLIFGNGSVQFGPIHANSSITVGTGANAGAVFHDRVSTTGVINGKPGGTFHKGFRENVQPIGLPTITTLNRLTALAALGNTSFTAPNALDPSGALMRLEFLAVDLRTPANDSTDATEGFLRVYVGNTGQAAWVRGIYGRSNCGRFWRDRAGGPFVFFPHAVYNTSWFRTILQSFNGMTSGAASTESGKTLAQVMNDTRARCFPGGDPHLQAVERNGAPGFRAAQWQKGGSDTTFTPIGARGRWLLFPSSVARVVAARRPRDAAHLFPLHRLYNSGMKGVVRVSGRAHVSGVVNGAITVYATGYLGIVDDLRYVKDPALGDCQYNLGMIAGQDVLVEDNALNTPIQAANGTWKWASAGRDVFIHGVMIALNETFTVENIRGGPANITTCNGASVGRGCIFITGGTVVARAGGTGTTGGTGFMNSRTYDRCLAERSPPYFPTTGRYFANRYAEVDPRDWNVGTYFSRLTP